MSTLSHGDRNLPPRFKPVPPLPSNREGVAEIDRAKAPSLGADRTFMTPEIQTAKLDNGMEIYVVNRPELPKVSVALGVRAGSIADPPGKEGVAYLTASTLQMGTSSMKALEINDRLGDLGVYLSGSGSRENSMVTFEALKRNIDPAMAIAADVVRNPSFPESEVERERKIHLDNIAQEENNPQSLVWKVARRLAFGPDHPYGRPYAGSQSSVKQINRDDLAQFHKTYWKPGGSALVFVGDITLAEATELARKHFGSWSGGAPPEVPIPAPQPAATGKIYVVDKQDAAQSVVAQVLSIPGRKTDDYYAINLADAVWGGGGFGTRLNLNLREDKGYSYGVFSFPSYQANAGWWAGGGGVQTNKTKESVAEFMTELRNLGGAKPITEAELATAKEVRLRGYSQEFETLGQIAGKVLSQWSDRMPMSELQTEPQTLQSTPLADVNAAAKKYAVPGKSFMLVIGDRSKVEQPLRSLGAGDVVLLDAEGRPVEASVTKAVRDEPKVPGN